MGLAALALGLWLIVRPVASLSALIMSIAAGLAVTGGTRLLERRSSLATRALGVLWVAVAAVVLWLPNPTVRWLLLIVSGYLVVDGLGDVWSGIRGHTDRRLASAVRGVATVIFGVLALAWPDVTLLVIAIVFAARLIVFGITQILFSIRRDRGEESDRPGGRRRWLDVVGAFGALAVAVILALVSSALNDAAPVVDAFYTPPDVVPDEPGTLIRQEPFQRGIPEDASAWRILYTTTRDEGQPAAASAIVVAPRSTSQVPREVIAWAHGTTGVAETCAPSILEGTFSTGAFFTVDEVIDEGWVLVATDYVGLGTQGPHPYLIGHGEARSVLDAVRAAHQVEGLRLAERTVVWGHSQGGNAALWTGVLAPTYAPDVDVIGVAALAPASDLIGLVSNLADVTGGGIFAAYAVSAYSAIYDDVAVADYVTTGGEVTVAAIAGRCLAEPSVLTSVLTSVTLEFSVFDDELTEGPLGRRFLENSPPYTIEAPLLLAQGEADSLVTTAVQDAYVAGLCVAGGQVDYRVYEGLDHVPLVESGSPLIPELFQWTHARLAGEEPISTC